MLRDLVVVQKVTLPGEDQRVGVHMVGVEARRTTGPDPSRQKGRRCAGYVGKRGTTRSSATNGLRETSIEDS